MNIQDVEATLKTSLGIEPIMRWKDHVRYQIQDVQGFTLLLQLGFYEKIIEVRVIAKEPNQAMLFLCTKKLALDCDIVEECRAGIKEGRVILSSLGLNMTSRFVRWMFNLLLWMNTL